MLAKLEDVEQMVVERNNEPVGTLRIVAPVVFGLHNLAPVLQTYTERYPKVIPDVTLVDRQVDLVEEGFDVGIVIARQMRSASIVTRRLTTGCLTVCATPGYLEKHGVPARPEDLSEHPSLPLPSGYFRDHCVITVPQDSVGDQGLRGVFARMGAPVMEWVATGPLGGAAGLAEEAGGVSFEGDAHSGEGRTLGGKTGKSGSGARPAMPSAF